MSELECGDHLIGSSRPGLLGGAEAELGSIHQHQTLLNMGAYGPRGPERGRKAADTVGAEPSWMGLFSNPSYCSHIRGILQPSLVF